MLVPLLDSGTIQQSEELRIPAFQLASNNQLQFRFALDPQRKGACDNVPGEQARQGIDPDSTIDFSGFAHYTAMPNLALFANAGYPFTRYADLLILSGAGAAPLLTEWKQDLALAINGDERKFPELSVASRFESLLATAGQPASGGQVQVNANGSLGAFISFQSPLSSDLAGNDAEAARALLTALEDDGKAPLILGGLAIVRGDTVQSFQAASVYYVGSLSWWKRLWFHLSQHVVLFTVVSLAVVVLAAMLLYGGLQRRVARRLAASGSQ